MFRLRAADIERLPGRVRLIEQRFCLCHLQLAAEPVCEEICRQVQRLLKIGERAVENTKLLIVLAQLIVVDGDGRFGSQPNEAEVILCSLLRCARGLYRASDATPRVDLVVENKR